MIQYYRFSLLALFLPLLYLFIIILIYLYTFFFVVDHLAKYLAMRLALESQEDTGQ